MRVHLTHIHEHALAAAFIMLMSVAVGGCVSHPSSSMVARAAAAMGTAWGAIGGAIGALRFAALD